MSETKPKKTRKKAQEPINDEVALGENSVLVDEPVGDTPTSGDEVATVELNAEMQSVEIQGTNHTNEPINDEVATEQPKQNSVIVTNNVPMDLFEAYSGTLLPFGVPVVIELDADGAILSNLKYLQDAHSNIVIEHKGQQ